MNYYNNAGYNIVKYVSFISLNTINKTTNDLNTLNVYYNKLCSLNNNNLITIPHKSYLGLFISTNY